ncbi:MAG: CotH kinase family protein [Fibrobacter sp.]|nr:CotH kinase family protein [Fibrobacter sp.]
MRYRTARPHPLLLGIIIGFLLCACSNSDGVDYAGWEEAFANDSNKYLEEDPITEPAKRSCFDSFRLPDLQSIACKQQFYSNDTVKDFPQSGFFPKTFTIAFPDNKPLNCETGGKPATKESPLVSAIQVDSSMAIRCADFSGKFASTEIIRTYILEKNPDIAVVFLTTDPNSLFDPDTGIYMEGPNAEAKEPHYGANYWQDKEIPVFVELVENEQNQPAFAKYAGLKIHGRYTRTRAKKSVAITFREKYGDKRLYYPLFPEFPEFSVFKSFILRNFGNSFGYDYVRDRLACSLSEGLGVDYQRGRYAIVYYNGKYFGLHDLREHSNEYYFETHYGISHNNINLLKADNSVSAGSADNYITLIEWLKTHSLDDDENFEYISSQIDLNNFINYMHVEIFSNNRDWPGNNLKKWQCTSPITPWKWFLYDLDIGFDSEGANVPNTNIFDYISDTQSNHWASSYKHALLVQSLFKNKQFKASFINRMTTILHTHFTPSQTSSLIEQMMNGIRIEIPRDQYRWGISASTMDRQLKIIKAFAQNREATIIKELQESYHLGDTSSLTLSAKGNGEIRVHNLSLKNLPITIAFFKGFPVTISAIPLSPNSWHGWSDGEMMQTRTIWPETITELTALFE